MELGQYIYLVLSAVATLQVYLVHGEESVMEGMQSAQTLGDDLRMAEGKRYPRRKYDWKRWHALNTWGKRWSNRFATWGKRGWNAQPFATWGKRDWNDRSFATWGKRDWNDRSFATWGKRDWNDRSFATWGKRDWNDRSFATWGKRDWNDRSFATWGKRPVSVGQVGTADKRPSWNQLGVWGKRDWTGNNQFATWGKRADADADDAGTTTLVEDGVGAYPLEMVVPQKRGWNQFVTWGKRDGAHHIAKRWANMASWGKRSSSSGEQDDNKAEDPNTDKADASSGNGSGSQAIPSDPSQSPTQDSNNNNTNNTNTKNDGMASVNDRDNKTESNSDSTTQLQTEGAHNTHKRWSNVQTWGKRAPENVEKKWKNMSVWGKRSDDEDSDHGVDKKWKTMSVWGKRSDDKDTDHGVDKKWKTMSVWGKRSDDEDSDHGVDKKWKNMSVWGKRSDDKDSDHGVDKKWKNMSVWGKRSDDEDSDHGVDKKWKNMSVWGKRSDDEDSPLHADKKWKNMGVWGKRSDGDDSPLDTEKRWKNMAVWGKRSVDEDSPHGLDKKWKNMAVWGKRSVGDDSPLDTEKRWKNMAVWGKRSDGDDSPVGIIKKWKNMSVWGKRSLGEHAADKKWGNMAAWGKREPLGDTDKRWNNMASWGKRSHFLDTPTAANKKWSNVATWGKRESGRHSPAGAGKRWNAMSSWGKRENRGQWNTMATWGKRSSDPNDAHLLHSESATLFQLFDKDGKEDRGTFQELAKQTLEDMMQAAEQGLMINDTLVKVKWVFCSDWKAMAIMRGVNPPNSNHFCLWCECSKSQILDFSVPDWPVTRSAKRQEQCLKLIGQANRRGYSTTDLVSWIPFEDMVPDELHLRMRITNKLLNQVTKWSIDAKYTKELLAEMKRIGVDFRLSEELGDDGVGKITKWTQPNGDALQKILGKLKVSNVLGQGRLLMTPQVGKLSVEDLKRELETRNLPTTGNKATLVKRLTAALLPGEKVILRQSNSRKRPAVSYDFSDEDLSGSEPDDDPVARAGSSTGPCRKDFVDIDKLEALWAQFAVLMSALKACPGTEGYMSGDEFGNHARRWASEFRKITFDEDVIPYIHCLVYHVPQALRKFRYLPDIGISQVERKNYDQHLAYFGATSREGGRHNMNVSKQILRRENVLLYYALNDEDIPKAKRRKVEKL